ncbi:hypothetical protein Z043_114520 [Scleropages formosus]|uniref:Uncharacterized protein n=1 Tax=Scleropages formosus TaxID=113540 RepID=A0A0P7U9U9_SCLFO|nr:hypothetical protein Z043_114520 [Scleropages formosus]
MLQYLPLLLCPLSTRRLLSCIPVPIPVLGLLKVMCSYSGLAAPDCQTDCIQVLTAPEGSFWSPCYPRDYPKNQACRWTLQAPAGFIVQIAFLDFELEEALGCIYDRVVVSTGTSDVTFCGITANGLTLNSSGNIMEVSFSSDFSVQKRGFNISYRQVAVALRNQKVALPQNAAKVIQVSNQVSIPTLQQFTVCFEVARTTQKKGETIFLYTDPSGNTVSFGLSSSGNVMALTMDGQECALSAILSPASFTATMKLFCLSWSSLSGRLNLYVDNNIRVASCAATTGKTITGGGTFRLGDNSLSFDGTVYNFRMWNYAMSKTEFSTLTCDAIGNVIDWDNAFWNIPSGLAQTDSTLSCKRTGTRDGSCCALKGGLERICECMAEEAPPRGLVPKQDPQRASLCPCILGTKAALLHEVRGQQGRTESGLFVDVEGSRGASELQFCVTFSAVGGVVAQRVWPLPALWYLHTLYSFHCHLYLTWTGLPRMTFSSGFGPAAVSKGNGHLRLNLERKHRGVIDRKTLEQISAKFGKQ